MPFKRRSSIMMMILPALAAGCGSSPPTRFYRLTPIHEMERSAVDSEPSGAPKPGVGAAPSNRGFFAPKPGIFVELAPLRWPEYLDRPQMVLLSGAHRVEVADFDRWAESLESNFIRVLEENLSESLDTPHVFSDATSGSRRPAPKPGDRDYRVAIDVERFDAEPGRRAVLSSRWFIFDGQTKTEIENGKTYLVEPLSTEDYADAAAAQSRLLAEFSRRLARTLQTLPSADVGTAAALERPGDEASRAARATGP